MVFTGAGEEGFKGNQRKAGKADEERGNQGFTSANNVSYFQFE